MSRSSVCFAPAKRNSWAALMLGLFVCGQLASRATASPIQSQVHQQALRPSQTLQAWAAFLAGGAEEWAAVHAPPINADVEVAMKKALASPQPLANVWVEYLLWRYHLNPVRFTHYHPNLGPILSQIDTPTPTPTPEPQNIPEPGTITISLILIGAACSWRWRSVLSEKGAGTP
jgi:hypothetical protein